MIDFLARIFVKNRHNVGDSTVRTAYGSLCSFVGIGLNVLLFVFKLFSGVLSGSIAITADAVNNLSDAGSSLITLIGFKLSSHKPDPEHPFGHGRIEYISGLFVSVIIMLMGFELAKSSLEKIVNPHNTVFSAVVFVILTVSVCVKLYMYCYNNRIGKMINSASMRATATDCMSDAVATVVVIASMLVNHFLSINVDGWCGILVAVFIFMAGIRSAGETISPLLGQPPEAEFVKSIENIVMSYDDILGLHDLAVHNYGPGRVMISLHAEIPADGDLLKMHDTVDNVERDLQQKLGCVAVIHMDPIVTNDEATSKIKQKVLRAVRTIDERIDIHDFRMVVGHTHTNVIFDITVPHDLKYTEDEIRKKAQSLVEICGDNLYAVITVDKPLI